MKRFLRLVTAALLCFASTGTLKAGFTNYDFNLDPALFFDGTTNSLILAGSASRNIFNPGAPPWTNDLVVSNALPVSLGGGGVLGGFAGGDSLLVAQAKAPGSIDAENGTKTGVSVVFDSWEGNWLPDTAIRAAGQSNDREGIAVRV